MPIPLLILSDSPTSSSGLGRITRDLATRIKAFMSDVFDVGCLGYGGPQVRALGYPYYTLDMQDWVANNLPEVWEDFAQGKNGALLTIWDASRVLWLARPENCPDTSLQKFLNGKPFQKWIYAPMDATGVHDKLTAILRHTLEGFDRVLAYSAFAEGVLKRTLTPGCPILDGLTFLPHGIDTDVFYPRDRMTARRGFGQRIGMRIPGTNKYINVPDDAFSVGIIATNQVRKDWGLGIATVAEIAKTRKIFLWTHMDIPERAWSIWALLNDFGLTKEAVISTVPLTDEQMAWCYSAMDVTLAIGLGEGFGYSAGESLACGTPAIAPNYGGGEFIPKEFLVDPVAWRIETPYNVIRPVMCADDFAARVLAVAGQRTECPEYIRWETLWPKWEQWLKNGVK